MRIGGAEAREQDRDGIDAEVLFALDVRNSALRDKTAFLAVVQGFNDSNPAGPAPTMLILTKTKLERWSI